MDERCHRNLTKVTFYVISTLLMIKLVYFNSDNLSNISLKTTAITILFENLQWKVEEIFL